MVVLRRGSPTYTRLQPPTAAANHSYVGRRRGAEGSFRTNAYLAAVNRRHLRWGVSRLPLEQLLAANGLPASRLPLEEAARDHFIKGLAVIRLHGADAAVVAEWMRRCIDTYAHA